MTDHLGTVPDRPSSADKANCVKVFQTSAVEVAERRCIEPIVGLAELAGDGDVAVLGERRDLVFRERLQRALDPLA